jgi:DNA polymerase-3 subunit delta'
MASFLSDTIAGHGAWRNYFHDAIAQDRLAHAYLFLGPESVGKWTMAKGISKRIACPNATEEGACGRCGICVRVDSGNHPDIHWVDALESGLRGVNVEVVRDRILPAFRLAPAESPMRVVVVNDADRMEVAAQNALLKTLEEPPRRSLLMLVARDATQLLDTVLSRCFLLRFAAVPACEFRAFLRRRGDAEADAEKLVTLADGFPGRALALRNEGSHLLQLATECLGGGGSPFEIAKKLAKEASEYQESSAFERRRQAAYGFCVALASITRARLNVFPDHELLQDSLEKIASATVELSSSVTPELVTDRLVYDLCGVAPRLPKS